MRRLRLMVWPRTSFARSALYVWKRLFRLQASPHKIALGFAAGVFTSITPLIGMQMIMAGAIALIVGGSLTAAMLATFVGNPLTWPLIWGATYALGAMIVGSPAEAASVAVGSDRLGPVVYTMLVGSIPLGCLAAVLSYSLTVRGVEAVRNGSAAATLAMPPVDLEVAQAKVKDMAAKLAREAAKWRAFYASIVEPSWRLW